MSDGEASSALFSISTEPEEEAPSDRILYFKELSIFPDEDVKPASRSKFRCFNCGVGEHNVVDCPQKYDRVAVAKNRAAFQLQRQMKPGLYNSREFKRYHIEVEGTIKTEAAPGIISDKLREALGISNTQLPPYVYRMRSLGYPPGWLEEAKISHSGINMLDTNGERVPDPEEEEGEIFISKTRFDVSKIIDYPGFNVWPSADTINETKKYGALQMQYSHSKTAFIEFLKSQMEQDVEYKPPVFDFAEDMDAEEVEAGEVIEGTGEFVPPLPGDHPPDLPPPPPEPFSPPPPGAEPEDREAECEDEEEGEIVMKKTAKRGVKRSSEGGDQPHKSARTSLEDSVHSGRTVSESSDDYHTPNNTMNSSFGRVINIEMGTPALKIHSPYTSLPPSENWKKGVSDVIDFENLPNSTGKYEKLKSVLKSVRDKLNVFRAQSTGNS